MPLYTFKDRETGEIVEKNVKISEYDQFKSENLHLERIIEAPSIGDPVRLGIKRTDDNFNSLLKHIKKGNSKGITGSSINTR